MATKQWKEKNHEKLKAYRRKWYAKNLTHAKEKVIERRNELKQWFRNYKLSLSCLQCGENDPCCLDFHHNGDKETNICSAVLRGWSRERILTEISKCTVLCANCHRKLHYKLKTGTQEAKKGNIQNH